MVVSQPSVTETKSGKHKLELDCQNDEEEGVRIIAWAEDADELSRELHQGDVRLHNEDLAIAFANLVGAVLQPLREEGVQLPVHARRATV